MDTQTQTPNINAPRAGTKQAKLVSMLSRKSGVTLAKASETFGWQPHTTRATMTGLKKRGYIIERLVREPKTVFTSSEYLGNSGHSLTEIAAAMQMNKRQIWRNLKMAFLAPDIQLAILSGAQPQNLCIQDLLDTQAAIDWNQQRSALGFT